MANEQAMSSVLMTHAEGLHARPSVKLTKLAKTFDSRIELGAGDGGTWIDAKSIVKVMATKAAGGTVLHFRAEGADAELAVRTLAGLVERDFDEAPAGGSGEVVRAGTG